ncbi:MAG TPA: tetratricopeptide repeat protein [Candidatus Kapabacteria bacterium]|jgi:tetratricopeptide (TPR) repeat protein
MKTTRKTLLLTLLTTLALQMAGCGAADVQSAKLYRQRRDYPQADKMLLKAIQEDPTNDEAWYLYAENLNDLKQFEKIASIIDTAMLYSTTHRAELQVLRHNTWIELYNGGLGAYSANPDSKDAQQAAMGYLESAQKLEPEQPETYELLGQVYYSAGDTAKGIANYLEEINQVSAGYNQGITMGLMLNMKPDEAQHAMGGAPSKQSIVPINNTDSAMIYVYSNKQTYVYFEREQKPPHNWHLTGWRVTSSDVDGMQPIQVSTQSYEFVANDYYQKGLAAQRAGNKTESDEQFEKAIPLLLTLQQIDPSNEFASQAIPDIYTRMERLDKAKQAYETILTNHPSKDMYISYGTLLLKSNDYQGAITAYQKALALAPNDESALFNLGATYKNMAAADQKANKKTEYTSELQQSTDYFEKLHAVNRNDPNVLMNLVENYDILGKKDKVISLVSDLEALKSTDIAQTHQYWDLLARVYARANRSADAQTAYKKSDELKQAGH